MENITHSPEQEIMDLTEYLEKSEYQWFRTGKTRYTIRAMMVSKELSFFNELEVTGYTVTDDGVSVILEGTAGEMWTSTLAKVISTYTKPDGNAITEADFREKDVFIDLVTKAAPDTNWAMFVPAAISVTTKTSWGAVLHTNLPNAPHGEGDYLVCSAGENGCPDLSDVWVVNGVIFPKTYRIPSTDK